MADKVDAPYFARRLPPTHLAGLVSGIFGYEERGEAMAGFVETASLTVPLIFNFGTPYHIALGRTPHGDDRYTSFAAGLYAGPVVMDSDGAAQCIQVNFTPLGGRLFFGIPMRELADTMAPFPELADGEIMEIEDRLAQLNAWDARLDLVERFVARRIARAVAIDPAVEWAYKTLANSGGRMRIGALARKLDWSRRRLVERFREDVGLPPKAVARIIRFNAAKALAASAPAPDWAGIAAECGYSDQSHLVREFGELAGTSPTAWRAAA